MNIQEWGIVERFGREGESYKDVITRISAELLPVGSLTTDLAALQSDPSPTLDLDESSSPASTGGRQVIYRPANVSRETSSLLSALDARIETVRVVTARTTDRPPVDREQLRLLTERQSSLALEILLAKE
jgi:hypothetical protein